MAEVTLLAGAGFAFAATLLYAFVGRHVGRREASTGDARTALTLFAVWWYALALTTLVSGLLSLAASLGVTDLALFVTATQMNLLAVSLALFGLLYYLSFLFTGSTRLLAPLAAFYAAFYAALVYVVTVGQPLGVEVGRWSTTLVYQNQIQGTPVTILVLLLVLPQIVGALAYFTLYFRLKDPAQRYRVAVVSWSIILWFSSAGAASVSGLSDQDWWALASRFVGLGAAVAILLAYYPPQWVQRRWTSGAPPARKAG